MLRLLLSLLVFVQVVISGAATGFKVADASQDQYDFFTELYTLTSGEMWVNNTNWLVNKDNITICNWFGISCAGKWVQKLDLSNNGLGGLLPDKWERVPYMESVDLSSNK